MDVVEEDHGERHSQELRRKPDGERQFLYVTSVILNRVHLGRRILAGPNQYLSSGRQITSCLLLVAAVLTRQITNRSAELRLHPRIPND